MADPKNASDELQDIKFSRMSLSDIAKYTSWFEDIELAARMYKPDEKWIEYVNEGTYSAAWSAYADGNLLAHIQSEAYQDGSHSLAIAINPKERRKGYSAKIITDFTSTVLKLKGPIFAFIEQDNYASIKAFERAGFTRTLDQPDEDGILKFILKLPR